MVDTDGLEDGARRASDQNSGYPDTASDRAKLTRQQNAADDFDFDDKFTVAMEEADQINQQQAAQRAANIVRSGAHADKVCRRCQQLGHIAKMCPLGGGGVQGRKHGTRARGKDALIAKSLAVEVDKAKGEADATKELVAELKEKIKELKAEPALSELPPATKLLVDEQLAVNRFMVYRFDDNHVVPREVFSLLSMPMRLYVEMMYWMWVAVAVLIAAPLYPIFAKMLASTLAALALLLAWWPFYTPWADMQSAVLWLYSGWLWDMSEVARAQCWLFALLLLFWRTAGYVRHNVFYRRITSMRGDDIDVRGPLNRHTKMLYADAGYSEWETVDALVFLGHIFPIRSVRTTVSDRLMMLCLQPIVAVNSADPKYVLMKMQNLAANQGFINLNAHAAASGNIAGATIDVAFNYLYGYRWKEIQRTVQHITRDVGNVAPPTRY